MCDVLCLVQLLRRTKIRTPNSRLMVEKIRTSSVTFLFEIRSRVTQEFFFLHYHINAVRYDAY